MVVEVELFACYVPVHVDGDDGFGVPLGSRLYEEESAVEDEGRHRVTSGTEKESSPANVALVYMLIVHDVLWTYLIQVAVGDISQDGTAMKSSSVSGAYPLTKVIIILTCQNNMSQAKGQSKIFPLLFS